MTGSNEKMAEEILLSKRMFFGGCLGLPWLWICNALYFRSKVFGPLVLVDYWPGQSPPPAPSAGGGGGGEGGDGNDDSSSDRQQAMDRQLEHEAERKELEKWVRRSTRGAFIVVTAFVAWIVTFQVNKDSFGSRWFVMDRTEAERTGW